MFDFILLMYVCLGLSGKDSTYNLQCDISCVVSKESNLLDFDLRVINGCLQKVCVC